MHKFLYIILVIGLFSCNIEDKSQNFKPQISSEELKVENDLFLLHDCIYKIHQKLNLALINQDNLNEIFSCTTIDTLNLANDTVLYTLNFGFGLCNDELENKLIGTINIKQKGNLLDLNNFYAVINSNDLQIMQNEFIFSDTLSVYESSSTQKIIHFKGSQTSIVQNSIISRQIDRLYTFDLTNLTNNFNDLTYTIEGNTLVTNGESFNFTTLITSKLIVDNNCAFIKNGILDILPNRKIKRIVNFGENNECDSIVQITVGNLSTNFGLTPIQ